MGFENGHLLRVTLRAVAGAHEMVNTFHYDLINVGVGNDNNPQSLADAFRDDVRPHWQALLTSDWALDPVQVVDEIDPQHPTNPRGHWQSGAVVNGTRVLGGDQLPYFCTPLVALKTGVLGRRFNGRMWLMASSPESAQAQGLWSGAELTSLQGVVDNVPFQPDISPPLSESTANWCIYSRTQRAVNADPYASHLTSAVVSNKVHSLRKRAVTY